MAFILYTINGKLLKHGDKLLGREKKASYDPVLENNTWAQIQSGLREGNPMGWEIGATKTVTLTNGDTYTARLVDLNKGRYQDTSNTDNVAVFEFVELIKGTTRAMNATSKTYDRTSSYTAGGWLNSDLRTYMNGSDLLGKFPEDLTSVMLLTKVGSAKYGGSGKSDTTKGGVIIYSDGDKVFVGAQSEFYASTTTSFYSYDTERALYAQWDYYKAHNTNADRVKHQLGSAGGVWYWNRSPHYDSSTIFCYVSGDGGATSTSANNTNGLAPCFAL